MTAGPRQSCLNIAGAFSASVSNMHASQLLLGEVAA